MAYRVNREFSDRFIPELRRIIGPYLLVPSSLEQDMREAADLVIFKARDLTISCRVRRPGYVHFGRQFTIRSRLDNGTRTEMQKVLEGWGDWMFYGHAQTEHGLIRPWWLIDLSHFRYHLSQSRKHVRCGETPNGDGTHFGWFDIDSFPADPPLLIAESQQEQLGLFSESGRGPVEAHL